MTLYDIIFSIGFSHRPRAFTRSSSAGAVRYNYSPKRDVKVIRLYEIRF